jgi:aspartyl-tRNA(Asn)/glutamyl-tRNA(Gln) amidotransferase subunit B
MTPTDEWVDEIRASLPELPDKKRKRFISEYGLPEYDADLLTAEKAMADWFEEVVKKGAQPKTVSNWMTGELARLLNEENKSIETCLLKPALLAEMIRLIDNGTISGKIAKTVFEEMYRTAKNPGEIIKEKGLVQISDSGAIEKAIDEIIAKNSKEVERFRAGDEKLISFFVGQVMKSTKGKANPQMVNEILKKKLAG